MRRTTGVLVGLMVHSIDDISGDTSVSDAVDSLRGEAVEVQAARDALADDLGC